MVIVNGVGATTLMEQLIVFRKCCHYLAEKGIEVVANIVGEVLTVQEMAGFSSLLPVWMMNCSNIGMHPAAPRIIKTKVIFLRR